MTINYVSPECGDGPDPEPCNVIGPEGAHHDWCYCTVERADGERCMAPVGECPCEPTRQFRVTRHTESSQVVTLPAVWPANGEQSAAHDAEAVAEARGWVGADTESSVSAGLITSTEVHE
jgi:hypothetical protein